VTNPFTSIVGALIAPVTSLISEAITDKDKAAEIAYKVATMAAEHAHAEVLAQIELNKVEAATGSLWVGGWRPGCGWVCVAAMAMNFLVIPIFGPVIEAYTRMDMVPLQMGEMMPILLGMLGLTAARTYEKQQGVAKP
jgi:hypothetical protein